MPDICWISGLVNVRCAAEDVFLPHKDFGIKHSREGSLLIVMKSSCSRSPNLSLISPFLLICILAIPGIQSACANEAEKPDAPEFIDGVTIVNAEGLIEKTMSNPDLVLVDSRIVADRKQGFIEGSISLPDIETSCDSLAGVIDSKSTPVMFYCNGVKCGRSAKAARIAVACDYASLYWYRNGMQEWKEKNYPLVQ